MSLDGILPPAADNRPGQGRVLGQASRQSCKKGLRNSPTKVPTPEAGALLSGLITLLTSTRGHICVRVYTLRREKENRENTEIEGKRREERASERKREKRRDTTPRKLLRLYENLHKNGLPLSACKARFYVRSADLRIRTQIAIDSVAYQPNERSTSLLRIIDLLHSIWTMFLSVF